MSFQAKLIFQDGSECGKKVGILYMKFCTDVHTMMGTSHIKICSDVQNRLGTYKCVQMFKQDGDTASLNVLRCSY